MERRPARARGLDDDLDAALAAYQSELVRRTSAVFDYTLTSAALRDPEPQAGLYRRIAARPDLSQNLMNVMGGSQSFRSLFNARALGGRN